MSCDSRKWMRTWLTDWALGSTTECCFSLTKQEPVISWKSKKKTTVSTCEAEYISLVNTTQESMYPTQLLNGMDNTVYSCTKIYVDNQGAIALSAL